MYNSSNSKPLDDSSLIREYASGNRIPRRSAIPPALNIDPCPVSFGDFAGNGGESDPCVEAGIDDVGVVVEDTVGEEV